MRILDGLQQLLRTPSSSPGRLAAAAISGLALAVLTACGEKPQTPPPAAAPTVTVARPTVRAITDWDEYTGRLGAVESVEVRARVSGYLQAVHFAEGAIVQKGTPLFDIDPRPYEAVLAEAKAEVTRARIRLELAENDLDRAQRLFGSRAISEEELDARTQEKREAVAALEAAEAAVSSAQLEVDFTRVKAPISGRIGRALVTKGNLIRGGSADSTLLTTLVSLDPIHFYFNADEQSVLRYVRQSNQGTRPSSRDYPNPVRLQLTDEEGFPHEGHVDFVDNQIDQATGTLQARAVFPNPDHLLLPGMFGKIQLAGSGPYEALLIPDEAVATDQADQFVYVIDDQNVAHRRAVKLGPLNDGLRVVREGLERDERVVVSGLQRVRPNAPVTPEAAEKTAAPAANTATPATVTPATGDTPTPEEAPENEDETAGGAP